MERTLNRLEAELYKALRWVCIRVYELAVQGRSLPVKSLGSLEEITDWELKQAIKAVKQHENSVLTDEKLVEMINEVVQSSFWQKVFEIE